MKLGIYLQPTSWHVQLPSAWPVKGTSFFIQNIKPDIYLQIICYKKYEARHVSDSNTYLSNKNMRRRGWASSKYLFSHQKYLLERVSLAWPVAFTYFHISACKSNAKAVVPACYLINLELFSLFLLQKLQYRDNSSIIPVAHTCFGFFSRKIIMRGQLY